MDSQSALGFVFFPLRLTPGNGDLRYSGCKVPSENRSAFGWLFFVVEVRGLETAGRYASDFVGREAAGRLI